MKYEAVFFDMDGTTLNTLEDLRDSMNVTLESFGFPKISPERAAENLGNGSEYYIRHSVPQGTDDEIIARMLSFYKPYYDTHCCIKTRPYDGINELISALKAAGIRVAVISNKPDSAVKELAGRFFPGVYAVGESSAAPRKPDPAMVLAAAEALGVSMEKCAYVGDTEVDIATALNSGADCLTVSWGFRKKEQLVSMGAEKIADSVAELYNMIMN